MLLLVLFIAIPMIEIALFIQVGGAIGLGWTLAIVLLTAILGSWLVRQQGAMALGQLQQSFHALSDPTEPLAHGAMILFSGALLLTPGFFTDAVGFLLLFPPVRVWVYRKLRERVEVQSFTMGSGMNTTMGSGPRDPFAPPHRNRPRSDMGRDMRGDVIDGEFIEIDDVNEAPGPRNRPPSGWTRHQD